MAASDLLKFRCTGCGNCCKEPLLPLTAADVKRISERTGDAPTDIVRFIDRNAIDMDDEPESFAMLRQGRRVMILRHQGGGCRYLGKDERCTIYGARPLGCRIFPFDPTFDKKGKLVYHGAIDDNSRDASAVKATYLKDALTAVSAGKKIKTAETKSIGCSIKFRDASKT